eukprot:EG_transcript_18776
MRALAEDLLLLILSFLRPAEVARCAAVDRRWQHAAASPLLWGPFYAARWGHACRRSPWGGYARRQAVHGNWVAHRCRNGRSVMAHTESVEDLCWVGRKEGSHRGLSLVTASRDRLLHEYTVDVPTLSLGQPETYEGHHASIWCVAASSRLLVSGAGDGELRAWDRCTGRPVHVCQDHSDSVFCVQLGEAVLASGSWDSACILRSPTDFRRKAVLAGHSDAVWRLQLEEQRGWLLTASWDGSCCLWDLTTLQIRDRCQASGSVLAAGVHVGNHELWALDNAEVLVRWDLRQPASDSRSLDLPSATRFNFIDGEKCVFGFADGRVVVYDVRRMD